MGRGEAYGALVLRVFLGVIYMAHAYLALVVMGPARAMEYQRSVHIPLPEIGVWYLIIAHGLGGLLLILGVPILSGIHAQRAGGFGAGTVPEGHSPAAILVYLFMIALTWALFGFCALGVRGRGIGALAGGRWTSWKSVGTDLAIMVPSWLILMGANVGVAWLLGARLPPVG